MHNSHALSGYFVRYTCTIYCNLIQQHCHKFYFKKCPIFSFCWCCQTAWIASDCTGEPNKLATECKDDTERRSGERGSAGAPQLIFARRTRPCSSGRRPVCQCVCNRPDDLEDGVPVAQRVRLDVGVGQSSPQLPHRVLTAQIRHDGARQSVHWHNRIKKNIMLLFTLKYVHVPLNISLLTQSDYSPYRLTTNGQPL